MALGKFSPRSTQANKAKPSVGERDPIAEAAAAGHETPGLTQKKPRAEIRNDGNQVVAGFSFADYEPVGASGFGKAITWKGTRKSDMATRDIRVVCRLTGAALFSFEILRQTVT